MYRRLLLILLLTSVAWSLGFGPMFPWSPWQPGYQQRAGKRVTVVWPNGIAPPAGLENADALLTEAEAFHRLAANRRIVLIVCRNWDDAYRMLPGIASPMVGGVTLATGTAIYILPRVAERRLDPVEFARHELSHAVLHQNQSIRNALRMSEVQWLSEGIAVWFGRQRAYITDDEFQLLARERELAPYLDPALRDLAAKPFDMRFAYVCWKHFNEYLESQGRDRYWAFVHAVIASPGDWRMLFSRSYGRSFTEEISAFQRQLRAPSVSAAASGELPTEPHRRSSRAPR